MLKTLKCHVKNPDMWYACILQSTISFELCSNAYEQHLRVRTGLPLIIPCEAYKFFDEHMLLNNPIQNDPTIFCIPFIECISKSFD